MVVLSIFRLSVFIAFQEDMHDVQEILTIQITLPMFEVAYKENGSKHDCWKSHGSQTQPIDAVLRHIKTIIWCIELTLCFRSVTVSYLYGITFQRLNRHFHIHVWCCISPCSYIDVILVSDAILRQLSRFFHIHFIKGVMIILLSLHTYDTNYLIFTQKTLVSITSLKLCTQNPTDCIASKWQ